MVLKNLASAILAVRPKKGEIGYSSIMYLGNVNDIQGLRPDPEKIAPILVYPALKVPFFRLLQKGKVESGER